MGKKLILFSLFIIRICDKITKERHEDLIIFLCNSHEILMKYQDISVILHVCRMSQIKISHDFS